jgi:hypothetical protein
MLQVVGLHSKSLLPGMQNRLRVLHTATAPDPHLLRPPPRARALATYLLLFAFAHAGRAHVSLASRTSQRLTNAYLTVVHFQSLQPCPPPPSVRCQYLPRRYHPLHWTCRVGFLVTEVLLLRTAFPRLALRKCPLPALVPIARPRPRTGLYCRTFADPRIEAIATSARAGQGAALEPLPASPCSASAPYPLLLPSRIRALVSEHGKLSTDLRSFRFCARRVLTCPGLPEPHRAMRLFGYKGLRAVLRCS